MKTLHIIFNKDLPNADQEMKEFRESLRETTKSQGFIELPNFNQLSSILRFLNNDINVYLWVHSAKGSKISQDGFDPPYVEQVKENLRLRGVDFKELTRSRISCDNKNVFHPQDIPEFYEELKCYSSNELKKLLLPQKKSISETNSVHRKKYQDICKQEISSFNNEFEKFKSFLKSIDVVNGSWWEKLLSSTFEKETISYYFDHSYWNFNTSILSKYLNLDNQIGVISDKNINVNSNIEFSNEHSCWEIDFSFFDHVSKRFEDLGDSNYNEKLSIATRLFLIHETIHKHHNLDKNSVEGIGNFPRIVEYVDFQSDAIAMIFEVFYNVYLNDGIENCDPNFIIKKFLDTIKVAIQTTFSFNPINSNLKLIQVRRVNRYSIWLWFYTKIEKLLEQELENVDSALKILEIFSRKPLFDISGPEIISKDNRTFYKLNSISFDEELAIVNNENVIKRIGKTSNLNFNNLYEGFKTSDFDKLIAFFRVVSSN